MAATTTTRPVFAPPACVVHVWPTRLDRAARVNTACLADAERDRLALRRGAARRRFAIAHAALRHVVGAYDGCAPTDARLSTDYGEPPRVASGLFVSLAHCDDLALIVVATSAVGVDVEPRASHPSGPDELRDLVDATLAEAENDLLEGTDARERPALWLRLWVRKEAALKARRASLGAIPLFELDVSGNRFQELTFVDLAPDSHHVGALALAAPSARVEWKDLGDVT